jgi:hypothetical protein
MYIRKKMVAHYRVCGVSVTAFVERFPPHRHLDKVRSSLGSNITSTAFFLRSGKESVDIKNSPPASYPDFLAIALRSPQAIVCCISSAAVHELTDEMPESTHFAVPKRSHTPAISYPPVTVFRFEEATFELGLTSIDAGPAEPVRMYDPARTVVDLMRFRKRFGEPTAYLALHRYLDAQKAQPKLLLDYAEALGSFGPMRAALDIANVR